MNSDTDFTPDRVIPKLVCRFCHSTNICNLPIAGVGIFGKTGPSNAWICVDCGKTTIIPIGFDK